MGRKKRKKRSRKKRTNPRASTSSQVIYLDACIIGDYIWGDEDQHQASKKILNKIHSTVHKNGNMIVKMSQLAVGELINVVMFEIDNKEHPKADNYLRRHEYLRSRSLEDIKEQMIKDIIKTIKDHKIDTPPISEDIFDVIPIVREYDNGYEVKGNDLFLLAHALADKDSDVFLTTDGAIIRFSKRVIDGRNVMKRICEELDREKTLNVKGFL